MEQGWESVSGGQRTGKGKKAQFEEPMEKRLAWEGDLLPGRGKRATLKKI